LEDPGIDGRIILKLIYEKWHRGMHLIDVAQDRERLLDFHNVLMNLPVLQYAGDFLSS
jgi:hypothetical protein